MGDVKKTASKFNHKKNAFIVCNTLVTFSNTEILPYLHVLFVKRLISLIPQNFESFARFAHLSTIENVAACLRSVRTELLGGYAEAEEEAACWSGGKKLEPLEVTAASVSQSERRPWSFSFDGNSVYRFLSLDVFADNATFDGGFF